MGIQMLEVNEDGTAEHPIRRIKVYDDGLVVFLDWINQQIGMVHFNDVQTQGPPEEPDGRPA